MKGNETFEAFARTLNDLDPHYPKGRTRCFDIGIWGGCGPSCAAYVDGECGVPEEMDSQSVIGEYGEEEAAMIFAKYKQRPTSSATSPQSSARSRTAGS